MEQEETIAEETSPASSPPKDASRKLKNYLFLSLAVVVVLVLALSGLGWVAINNATRARDYDAVASELKRVQDDFTTQRKTLRHQFGENLGNSFADAQAAASAKNYGLALRELDKIKPWLQLGKSAETNLSRVESAFAEAQGALENLSPDAPQKVEALIQAARELSPEKKL